MKLSVYIALMFSVACSVDVPESVDLGLDIQKQEAGNWCWAAIAQSIGASRGEQVTQSEVVSITFDHPCTPATCNAPNNMKKYLAHIGMGMRALPDDAIPNNDQLREIMSDGGIPVIRYRSPSGFTHFVELGGYNSVEFQLLDPAFGSTTPVNALSDYRAGWEVAQVVWAVD